jgi:hypothetical protein
MQQHPVTMSNHREEVITFAVNFTQLGKQSVVVAGISHSTTAAELLALARSSLEVSDDAILRLICSGKTIAQDRNNYTISDVVDNDDDNKDSNADLAFPTGTKIPKSGIVKVVVIGGATKTNSIQTLNSQRSDPLMRGFDDAANNNKKKRDNVSSASYWGPLHQKSHFRRVEECPDASFGTRPTSTTPHAFEARRLLERLASDPGIVAIMSSRKLVVGTLGEMDPIDDVLMHKTHKQSGGAACLLGYNTNHGLRIDIKLRTEDLSSFRPYRELVATLIHELSHNWVEEHNVVFWTNYGHLRVEYLWEHACLRMGGMFVNGKRTSTLAEVEDMIVMPPSSSSSSRRNNRSNRNNISNGTPIVGARGTGGNNSNIEIEDEGDHQRMDHICRSVCQELEIQMTKQHHIPVALITPGLLTFGNELIMESRRKRYRQSGGLVRGQKLGSNNDDGGGGSETRDDGNGLDAGVVTAKELALAAAEKRRQGNATIYVRPGKNEDVSSRGAKSIDEEDAEDNNQ